MHEGHLAEASSEHHKVLKYQVKLQRLPRSSCSFSSPERLRYPLPCLGSSTCSVHLDTLDTAFNSREV